jgi:SagB-type dehydrogenase family enzyme
MNRIFLTLACVVVVFAACGAAPKEDPAVTSTPYNAPTRVLPAAETKGGLPLNETLAARRSCRAFDGRKLTDTELGQLLWAGQGITSAEGKRTAPSAMATFPLTLFVFDDAGIWYYEPTTHALRLSADGDRRAELAAAAPQKHVAQAPVAIVIVADLGVTEPKFGAAKAERFAALEAGHIAQSIALEATSLGLGAVTMTGYDDAALARILDLGPRAMPMYLIPVGARATGK